MDAAGVKQAANAFAAGRDERQPVAQRAHRVVAKRQQPEHNRIAAKAQLPDGGGL